MRVLVVEDDRLLADAITRGLRRNALAVDTAYDGAQASERVGVTRYDIVVLDRDLPLVPGDEVCGQILARWGGEVRVLMLTAAVDLHSRVQGLGLGADDYLTKPFAFEELVARVQALLRRSGPATSPILRRGGIELDPARFLVTRDGSPIRLAPKEFAVLRVLMAVDGAVLSAEDLLDRAWDENADPFTNSMRTTIATLRRKLGPPTIIETLVGAGYRIR
ncbi:response regulator transcription factor [Nocardia alni]|uniref:response regulator transcription factor n=1 Tax=Nocardia alni TaxID=2815723 RepID=UPI001C24F373|nr:response regulator transcription factor [Nocardia alni]